MIFGDTDLSKAEGLVLAHSLRLDAQVLKKGRILSAEDVAALRAAGYDSVIGARLEADDLPEDAAASLIAKAVAGENLTISAAFTGRCNLFAQSSGVLSFDAGKLNRLNALDESLTLATLPRWEDVSAGQMVATVKIIPFAVRKSVAQSWLDLLDGEPLLRLHPYCGLRVALILTTLPGLKESILDGTERVTRQRVEGLGGRLVAARRVPHMQKAVAAAMSEMRAACDLILISGASATVDRRDVVPAGIVEAGGEIRHFGMPVDPGNLLLLADLQGQPILDMPGCGRSPKLNGLDWVLRRLLAGLDVTSADIAAMGAGGLLKEIPTRPMPRDRATDAKAAPKRQSRVAAIILAAGMSRRMGRNKLLEHYQGRPLVARVAEAALASQCASVQVVLGHQAEALRNVLPDGLVLIENAEFESGMASSLRIGIASLPEDIDAALICLGDMPLIRAEHLDRLIAAFDPQEGRDICIAMHQGRRGNPVLIGRKFFGDLLRLQGDIGARPLILANPDSVCEVEMQDEAVLLDIDTAEALKTLGEKP